MIMEEKIKINVQGQMTGEAELIAYGGDSKVRGKKQGAVIVCPGGGYWQVVSKEGEPVARQFVAMGYKAFVLKYSVLPNGFPVSLLELAKAVAIVRERADDWGIDPDKIVVCGFSAGGHLACSLGVFWNREFVWGAIGVSSKEIIRPNGMILGYPVITSGEYAHNKFVERLFQYRGGAKVEDKKLVSLENQVGSHTPKEFIWQTCTDQDVPVENSLLLAKAMREYGLNVELHIFPDGPHGLSLATSETSEGKIEFENAHCSMWTELVGHWLNKL
ncbi:alpha/beta hydrolase fold domain-containing protein [Defluviitalea raffinosedens]|uniref:Alpha/beta hydrolase fold domain-containing protein n=2 Tax=Defluviitalea raffinosedens TaxID=1450156 RepID=A0A7C8HDG9_9FIRM|nr:alpha/beta hydrolase fold domain-containing protein [Defluviitalea raffinosedens]